MYENVLLTYFCITEHVIESALWLGLCLNVDIMFTAYAICAIMVSMAVALLGNTCALRYHQPHSHRMGILSRFFILHLLGCILCCKNCCPAQRRRGKVSVTGGKPAQSGPEDANEIIQCPKPKTARTAPPTKDTDQMEWQDEWHTAAKILDRFFFFFFLAAIIFVVAALVFYGSHLSVLSTIIWSAVPIGINTISMEPKSIGYIEPSTVYLRNIVSNPLLGEHASVRNANYWYLDDGTQSPAYDFWTMPCFPYKSQHN